MINWDWFNKYFKDITLIFGVLFVISKIDIWVNGTEKSIFLTSISPFVKSVFGDFLMIILILLVAIAYNNEK